MSGYIRRGEIQMANADSMTIYRISHGRAVADPDAPGYCLCGNKALPDISGIDTCEGWPVKVPVDASDSDRRALLKEAAAVYAKEVPTWPIKAGS